ncbi:TetR/AcrR family transcriptional regulator [Arthrobacter burdickii]|uniref:TetR family transcriptional regulator C-terminal domain-containing protein n=1 Tax=Arthrobacter burdickii TaxID=3035920 RepID=A0ABT8JZ54_9MICC|nr:TetR family transcriptional regulator C-terminal domain-containing protein [Arthrobacter burdickii]MDN4610460.1 TetR family transcriptional regulator C-terminal domain-containing protein [Arthrobacter burdickii]
MPKIVDHDARRLELVEATWRIIARMGPEAATMRQIALEAGFANGALKPYFPSKDTLLAFAFGHVLNRTNARIAEAKQGQRGLAALRIFCQEILPLDAERLNEARIVIPFWQQAVQDPEKSDLYRRSMDQWRAAILAHLHEARIDGEVTTAVEDPIIAAQLLDMLLGAQVTAVFGDDLADIQRRTDDYFTLLR